MKQGHYVYLNGFRKSRGRSTSRMCGDATIYPTTMNFAKVEEVVIVIIYTKFGEDLYSSLDFTGSEILHVCIDLTTSHYNIACTAVQLVIHSDLVSSVNLQPKRLD
jgi:hypothetical protein